MINKWLTGIVTFVAFCSFSTQAANQALSNDYGGYSGNLLGSYEAKQGDLTYSIPIALPRGSNGYTPDLSLTFNSANSGGQQYVANWWYLSGISTISICLDKYNNNTLCLDNERLVKLSNGQYVPEVNNQNLEIKVIGDRYLHSQWNNLKVKPSMVVTNKTTGEKSYYGGTKATSRFGKTVTETIHGGGNHDHDRERNVTKYFADSFYIYKKEDINKNTINYTYDTVSHNLRVSSIEYSGNEINFTYPNNKLTSITYDNQYVKSQYSLKYSADKKHINQLNYCVNDTECVTPLNFAYKTFSGSPFSQLNILESFQATNDDKYRFEGTFTKYDGVKNPLGQKIRYNVLSSIEEGAGDEQDTTNISYTYSGEKYDSTQKSYLGFKKITEKISDLGYIDTIYNQSFPYFGEPTQVTMRDGNHSVTDITSFTYEDISNNTKYHVVRPTQEVTKLSNGSGRAFSIETTTRLYEDENLTSVDILSESDFVQETYSTVTLFSDYDNHLPQTKVAKYLKDGAVSNEYRYTQKFNATKKLKEKKTFHNNRLMRTALFDYDSSGKRTKETQNGFTYTYDAQGNITNTQSISRANTIQYSGEYPQSTTDPLGRKEHWSYNQYCGQPTAYTDINQQTSTAVYDVFCRKISSTDNTNLNTTIRYEDARGDARAPRYAVYKRVKTTPGIATITEYINGVNKVLRLSTVGFHGDPVIVDYQYDRVGRIVKESLPYYWGDQIGWLEYAYDVLGRKTRIISPINTTTFTYTDNVITKTVAAFSGEQRVERSYLDPLERIETVEQPEGSYVSFRFDGEGNTVIANANGELTHIEFGPFGQRTQLNDPIKGVWSFRYNSFNEEIWKKDANGTIIANTYDAIGRVTDKTYHHKGQVLTDRWEWDSSDNGIGELSKIVGDDISKAYRYDRFGRLATITQSSPNKVLQRSFGYDGLGRIATDTRPGGFTLFNEYNDNGYLSGVYTAKEKSGVSNVARLTSIKSSLNKHLADVKKKAEANRRSLQVISEELEVVKDHFYREKNTQIDIFNDSYVEGFQIYRGEGDVVYYRDGNSWYIQHWNPEERSNNRGDDRRRPLPVNDEDFFTYIEVTKPSGVLKHIGGVERTEEHLEFDGMTAATDISDMRGKKNIFYHLVDGLPNSAQQEISNLQVDFVTHFRNIKKKSGDYGDIIKEIEIVTAQLDRDINLFSDQWSRALKNNSLDTLISETNKKYLWIANDLDAGNRISSYTTGNGLTTVRQYNSITGRLDRIQTHGLSLLRDLSYEYDSFNNVIYRKDGINDLSEEFEYDGLDRLTNAKFFDSNYNGFDINYSYDRNGNFTEGNRKTYSYGAGAYQLTSVYSSSKGDESYTYDHNGNIKNAGTRKIYWDHTSKPSRIIEGNKQVNFSYAPDGRRYLKESNNQTTVYFDQIFEEVTTGSKSESKHYIYAYGKLQAIHTESSRENQTKYLYRDALGSIDTVADEMGLVLERYSYEPFGMRRDLSSLYHKPLTISETNRGFTGHEHVDEFDLIHMNGRIYDPAIGRFISADGFIQDPYNAQSYNRYAYAFNNPLKYVDPTGYIAIKETPKIDNDNRRNANNERFKGDREHKQKSERDSLTPGEEVKEPEPEEEVSGWDRFLSGLNTTLDAAGLAPGVGIVPDVLSAIVYVARGLPGEAALSMAAATPGVGQAVTAGRYAKRAAAIATKKTGKTYQTYTKTDPVTGKVYTGRTSGFGTPEQNIARRDASHHMNQKGYGPASLDKTSFNKSAIRGREQQMIDAHGGAQSMGGTSGNKINGVSPRNPNKQNYRDQAQKEFGG
ncbi:RHS repeat-associated core domain-containing protein [Vibrio tasmaniensis]|uniref:RHS repeat-associated core domain-containing protein n=1 Tax=Vibrio tasmaniensis TaxID=212663 RepID=UPI001476F2CE|nr:RHS repeat-associated core domain-containing protein [Vibrio tasmaniensis]